MKAVVDRGRKRPAARLELVSDMMRKPSRPGALEVGLLTGGDDKSYAYGLTDALVAEGVCVDFIGSDALDSPHLHRTPSVNFLNLRGDQNEKAGARKKIVRIIAYYLRLLRYSAVARPPIFHILWNNKFELIDRTILMVYYKMAGRKIAFTAHNVNVAKRDSRDSWLNRISLAFQYRIVDHIFVHTNRMKEELIGEFSVHPNKVSVIPFGINNIYPCTRMTTKTAKERLGLSASDKTMLFFGQIAPYKGLEHLISAIAQLKDVRDVRLIIAGKVKAGYIDYWSSIFVSQE
jgi:D-inositol-3-phosphate glycosyltransferase